MVHKAILGSIERFLSVYIEHTGGKFPVWLAPEQVRIITVNQEQPILELAQKIAAEAKILGLRLTVDSSNESVGKKIRTAEVDKVPYVAVIGDKEVASGEITPRIRKDIAVMEVPLSIGIGEFLKTVANEYKSRVIKTSL
jgi:threonyl-tRNA synthetase